MSDDIYGKTKHFTYYSQHEECVIYEMVQFYLRHENFQRLDIMQYYKETAETLLKEMDDSPCFCHTCTFDREHPEAFGEMLTRLEKKRRVK